MDKSAVRKAVSAWLKETVLIEGEEFAVFPECNHIAIRILDAKGTYRSEYSSEKLKTLPLKEKREGVHYEKCPNCGKKGMRDSRYVMKPLERAMFVFKVGGKICKYCGYAEYLVPKDGKAETKHTITYLERETKVWLQKQKEER